MQRKTEEFQSTRPSRASTPFQQHQASIFRHFNPQGPHGPRRCSVKHIRIFSDISIHKALTGLDPQRSCVMWRTFISIHKALTGLDFSHSITLPHHGHFNPQGPHGPRLAPSVRAIPPDNISIHKALTGLDFLNPLISLFTSISIHKALTGLDSDISSPFPSFFTFQSTRPSRASTYHFSPISCQSVISIHKALTGLDHKQLPFLPHPSYFNPQGPHGPRQTTFFTPEGAALFQSTRPSRASTMVSIPLFLSMAFQSTRPSRASTAFFCRMESTWEFQSTRPSRASTISPQDFPESIHISIHKALTGLDILVADPFRHMCYFNPQGPHGPRLNGSIFSFQTWVFQSTRPSRASTDRQHGHPNSQLFQSTRPSRASTAFFCRIAST